MADFTPEQRKWLRDIGDTLAYQTSRINAMSAQLEKLRAELNQMRRHQDGTFIPNIERRQA